MATPTDAFDACVVGSGAGGGAAAYALCRAGLRVVVLEKGPALDTPDFIHDELALCRRPFFLPSPLEDPNVMAAAGGAGERTTDGWISCCVGGGTVHMSGYFFRMQPEDFALRSRFGDVRGASVADWPFGPDELGPFYLEAERVLGVSGDAAAEPRRRPPYPLGPLLSHPAGRVIDEACTRLGMRPFRMARAIVSAAYEGRPACSYCGFCASYGCEVGAKSSSPATFLALAAATGKLTLRPRTPVLEVTADAHRRATGVVIADGRGGQSRIRARVVVLAAAAIQTARLLLLSRLANGSGLVGHNLMFQGQAGGWGRFSLPSPHFPPQARTLPFIDRAVLDHYVVPPAAGLPHPKAGTLIFQLPHPNPIFQSERLATAVGDAPPMFGAALKRRMREFFHETRSIDFEAFAEWLPTPATRVTLDPEVKDGLGLPAAHIAVEAHPATRAALRMLSARGTAVLEAAGARAVGVDVPRGPASRAEAYPFLQAGTARMGRKRDESVLDPAGQAHDVRNLYVADASGFPSAGGAPHTLTIMANALRVASHIAARARAGTL